MSVSFLCRILILSITVLLLFEEFEIKFHCISMLKRLLEGRVYAYPVKCLSDKLIQFKGPVIFISNYNYVNEDALVNRLKFVHADVAFREAEVAEITNEEMEDVGDEVVEVSSSEVQLKTQKRKKNIAV